MPLCQMDPNLQETEAAGRKRSHLEFSDDVIKGDVMLDIRTAGDGKVDLLENGPLTAAAQLPANAGVSTTATHLTLPSNHSTAPIHSSPGTGAESSTATPHPRSPSSNMPLKSSEEPAPNSSDPAAPQSDANSKPVIKRKRLTAEEKEAREKEQADKKKEREAQAAVRAVEKAKIEEEKAARAKERDEKRKKKEEEDRVKADKKRKREEDLQRIQADKEKKARSQMKLNNFFNIPTTPKKVAVERSSNSASPGCGGAAAAAAAAAEPKAQISAYEQRFRPFFVKKDTRWTKATTMTQIDAETQEARAQALDDYISGRQKLEDGPTKLDFPRMLHIPQNTPSRGLLHLPVRHIMEAASREADRARCTGSAAPHELLQEARKKLARVPVKVIAFSQDVRPPYRGTLTHKPFDLGRQGMHKLARKPGARLLSLDYDYDSEAEWQEEEGEDVDVDDEDDELEDEDDMDGFLDDSEDLGPARRIFANTMEPDCSGLRFDTFHGSSDGLLLEYRMEFITERTRDIDPWTSQYWEPEPKKKKTATTTTTSGITGSGGGGDDGTNKMAPPPAPSNAFEAIRKPTSEALSTPSSAHQQQQQQQPPPRLVRTELWDQVKRTIVDNKALSKGSIVDIIFHRLGDGVSRLEVKNTVELLAEKRGPGRSKEWDIREEFKTGLV